MKNSKNVVMDRCQRCATGVLDCANKTVEFAKEKNINAFSDLIMKPVEGVNAVDNNAVSALSFEKENEELDCILKDIQSVLRMAKADKTSATVGILLRSNFSVNKWAKTLQNFNVFVFL